MTKITTYYNSSLKLLFDIVPNGIAGYSMDRMYSGYTGSVIKLRRDSDNLQQDIGFSGNLFNSSEAASFLAGANGFAQSWYDQIGISFLRQLTADLQPQLVNDLLRGDGINDQMDTSSSGLFAFPAVAGDLTFAFWARDAVSNTDTRRYLAIRLPNGLNFIKNISGYGMRLSYNNVGTDRINTGATGDFSNGNWYHYIVIRSGATIELFIDNVSRGTNTTNTNFTTNTQLTIHTNAGVPRSNCDVDHIGFWDRAVTTAERATIMNFNAKK